MKKILLAATILVAITTSAFADGKKSNAKLVSDLSTALKSVNESSWKTTDTYRKATFSFNGKSTSAYINAETGNLIGFSIAISTDALPEGTMENISKKFQGWQVTNSIMFIDASGNADYYVQVDKNSKSLALEAYPNGKVGIYAHMPQ
jgi:hypothetical protein